jgi:hypothetical protein
MLDRDHGHAFIDPVDDPVVATACAVQPFEVEARGLDALRIDRERAVDERDGRRSDLLGQSLPERAWP